MQTSFTVRHTTGPSRWKVYPVIISHMSFREYVKEDHTYLLYFALIITTRSVGIGEITSVTDINQCHKGKGRAHSSVNWWDQRCWNGATHRKTRATRPPPSGRRTSTESRRDARYKATQNHDVGTSFQKALYPALSVHGSYLFHHAGHEKFDLVGFILLWES